MIYVGAKYKSQGGKRWAADKMKGGANHKSLDKIGFFEHGDKTWFYFHHLRQQPQHPQKR